MKRPKMFLFTALLFITAGITSVYAGSGFDNVADKAKKANEAVRSVNDLIRDVDETVEAVGGAKEGVKEIGRDAADVLGIDSTQQSQQPQQQQTQQGPAQAPTMDKLEFSGASGVMRNGSATHYLVSAANKQISGAVVIPATYDGDPVDYIGNFENCVGITSVIIPASIIEIDIGRNAFKGCTGLTAITIPENVTGIDTGAFQNCTNLTSVTFQRSSMASNLFKTNTFPGDLRAKYMAKNGGAGTYTRSRGSNTWTK